MAAQNGNLGTNRKLEEREHLLQRPEMYLQNVVASTQEFIGMKEDGTLERRSALVNTGVVHTLVEIMSNAADNAVKNGHIQALSAALSKARGPADVERICRQSEALIVVELTPTCMAVTNYGTPFEIDYMPNVPGVLVPEACFLLTRVGSNFDDGEKPRIGVGRNGYGAKIALYYSKAMRVECFDAERRRYFHMEVLRNGDPGTKRVTVWPPPQRAPEGGERILNGHGCPLPMPEPVAAAAAGGRSFTRVEWVPDSEEGELPPAAAAEWARGCAAGDILAVRRQTERGETETLRLEVSAGGPDLLAVPAGGGGPPQRVLGLGGLRHLLNVTRRRSCPETALVFQGSSGLSEGEIALAARRALDFAVCGVPFLLRRRWADGRGDERLLPPLDVRAYGRLLFGGAPQCLTLRMEPKGGVECEAAFFDTPGAGVQLGFVNGLFASEGLHMHAAQSAFLGGLKRHPALQKYAPGCTVRELRQHVSAVVLVRGPNPTQEGQTKNNLTMIGGRKSLTLPPPTEEEVRAICGGARAWGAALALMEGGKRSEVEELRGALRHLDWPRYMPANELGPQSTLMLAEGLSCAAYLAILRNLMGHSDRVGIGPLRGVPRNLYGADAAALLGNLVFARVISKMGLDPAKRYETQAEVDTLRYGSVVFVGDPDLDGFHIVALLTATLYHYWPALFAQRRIGVLRTPTVRVYRGKAIAARYYSDKEFEAASREGTAPEGRPKRIKGLASVDIGTLRSPGAEVRDDFEHAALMWFDVGPAGRAAIHDFFSAGGADVRKGHIARLARLCMEPYLPEPAPECGIPPVGHGPVVRRPVEDYIGKELIQYCLGALIRQIPDYRDGLKDVARKILWWWLSHTEFGARAPEHKVDRLCGQISSAQQYHHGPASLGEAIKALAVGGFCGANNLPLLEACSNGGTKLDWPHDAGADRYVIVTGAPWLRHAFNRTVCEAVPRKTSDDEEIEPEFVPCLLPIALANGFSGVATGWASTHPACHPRSLLAWLRHRAERDLGAPPSPAPEVPYWYEGFQGTMELTHAPLTATIAGDPEPPEPADPADPTEGGGRPAAPTAEIHTAGARSLLARGTYSLREPTRPEARAGAAKVLVITEVPPSVRLARLNDALAQLEREGHVSRHRSNLKAGIHYEVGLTASGHALGQEEIERRLHLVASHPLGNFFLLDECGAPFRIPTHYDYLERYYAHLLRAYAAGKELTLQRLRAHTAALSARHRYIQACLRGRITLGKMSRAEYTAALQEIDVPPEVARRVDGFHLTLEAAAELEAELAAAAAETLAVEARPPAQMYHADLLNLERHLPHSPPPRRLGPNLWGPPL